MGLNTIINEGGTGLSGGQRQALLLARTLRGDLDDYPPFLWK